VDREQRDELGLERTLGPFDRLDDAKAKADEIRSGPAEASPLQGRLRGEGPGRRPKLTILPDGARDPGPDEPLAAPAPPAAPARPAVLAPRKSWLDRLPEREARRARARIAALESIGAPAADAMVKRDIDGDVPATSTHILGRAIRRSALDPWTEDAAFDGADRATARVLAKLRKSGASDDDLRDFADFVARRTIDRMLDVVSSRERDPDVPATLPGWRLVEQDLEHPESTRRLFLSVDDLPKAEPPRD